MSSKGYTSPGYEAYLSMPLDTHTRRGELYRNGWVVFTGRAFAHPHPHRHYTYKEFLQACIEKGDMAERFTTNDTQAEYGEQPKREPLLSDEEFERLSPVDDEYLVAHYFGKAIRDFYESKIASGELMVVKTAKGVKLPPHGLMWGCEHCERQWTRMDNFCPGCGAKIFKG